MSGTTSPTAPSPPTTAPPLAARLGRRLFRVRGWVFLPFVVFALAWFRGEWEDERILWPLGLAVMAGGVALRFAAIRRIGGAARVKKDAAKVLHRDGPYAWMRNPLYLANLAVFAGFLVLAELPWMVPTAGLLVALHYHCIVAYEERLLGEIHGEAYLAYRARVPRWIPRPPGPAPRRGDAYPWPKLLRRERGFVANCLLLVLLAAAKEWASGAFAPPP
jgi:protein-S-isoprenylcysteine O-methyltransferase Ste14